MIKAIILDDGSNSKDVVVKFGKNYESAPDTLEEDPIVAYDTWVNLSSEIRGDGK